MSLAIACVWALSLLSAVALVRGMVLSIYAGRTAVDKLRQEVDAATKVHVTAYELAYEQIESLKTDVQLLKTREDMKALGGGKR